MSGSRIDVGTQQQGFRLAKAVGVLAITASAVSAEYGAGINFVSVQSLSVYPDVKGLVPLAMFVCGIAMLPKVYLFAAFSRVMPRAGSKHVWLACTLGLPAGFLITFTYWASGPAGMGFLAYAFGNFLGSAVVPIVALVLLTAIAAALFHAAPWWAVIGLIKAHKGSYATAPGLIGLVAPQWLTVILNLAVALIVGKTLAPGLMVASGYCFAQAQDRMLPAVFAQTSGRKVPLPALLLIAGAGTLFLAQSVFVGWAMGVAIRSLAVLGMWLALAVGTLNFRWHKGYGSTEWGKGVMQQPLVVAAAIISIILSVPLIVSLAVLPNTPLIFQPLVQGAGVLAIGVAILLAAGARLRSEGSSFRAIAAELPIE
jgi:amino acid transporter